MHNNKSAIYLRLTFPVAIEGSARVSEFNEIYLRPVGHL